MIRAEALATYTYPPWHLEPFVSTRSNSFAQIFHNHLHILGPNVKKNISSLFEVTQDKLRITSNRLRTNVDLFCGALPRFSQLHPSSRRALLGSFLVGAYFSRQDLSSFDFSFSQLNDLTLDDVDLRDAKFDLSNLRNARLTKCNLRKASLVQTNLKGLELQQVDLTETVIGLAQIDDSTNLEEIAWWKSDFGRFSDQEDVDTDLFKKLFARYGEFVPADLNGVHHSIREHLRDQRKDVLKA